MTRVLMVDRALVAVRRRGIPALQGHSDGWVGVPVGEGAPYRLHGAEAVVSEPDWTEGQVKQPNAGDYDIELVVLEFTVETKAESVEENGATDAGE
jgi:hypothetical protein